jgi:predicted aconitase with swiveling domain
MRGRTIHAGRAAGRALVSTAPIGFLGGVNPEDGIVMEAGHPLQGQSVAGKILVFPTGKGSTVGSYTILRLKHAGKSPAAIINAESEAIVAVGAIISDIPMVDQIPLEAIRDNDWVEVDDGKITVTRDADSHATQAHE